MGEKLNIAVVGAVPPSRSSLNEYGYHFIGALLKKDEVGHVYALSDDLSDGTYASSERLTVIPAWRHNALGNIVRIWRTVRSLDVDAVIFNAQYATFGDRKVPAALGLLTPGLLRFTGTTTIVLLHNLADLVDLDAAGFGGSRMARAIIRGGTRIVTRLILRAHLVAVTIPKYVEFLASEYGADNVALLPHGSFEQVPEPSFDLPDGPPRLLAFGKWGTYKRVDELLEAFVELRQERELELCIAGTNNPNAPGYLEALEARYASTPGIEFTGYVAEEDVPALFRGSAMVVFPYTATTGSSGVLHQAGDHAKPVVLPRIGDFVELIEEEGFQGEYFEPADPASMADAIRRLLDDDGRRRYQAERNFRASQGLPIGDVVDWYLIHIERLRAS